jgi:hypothetical protein
MHRQKLYSILAYQRDRQHRQRHLQQTRLVIQWPRVLNRQRLVRMRVNLLAHPQVCSRPHCLVPTRQIRQNQRWRALGHPQCYSPFLVEGHRPRVELSNRHSRPLTRQIRNPFSHSAAQDQAQVVRRNRNQGKAPPCLRSILIQRTRHLPLSLPPRAVCLVIPPQRILRTRIP